MFGVVLDEGESSVFIISNGFTSVCDVAKECIDKECDGSVEGRCSAISSAAVTESSDKSES